MATKANKFKIDIDQVAADARSTLDSGKYADINAARSALKDAGFYGSTYAPAKTDIENILAEYYPAVQTPAQQPAAAADTGTMTYADFLEQYGKKYSSGDGGMSYEQYLAKLGADPKRDYQKAVREAETEYHRARAGYGQKAETLGRAGLGGSGYSDYIEGAAFAATQNAKVAAADTKALQETQLKSDYYTYLASQQAKAAEANARVDAENQAAYAEYIAGDDSIRQSIQVMAGEGQTAEQIKANIGMTFGGKSYYNADRYGVLVDEYMKSAAVVPSGGSAVSEADLTAAYEAATSYLQNYKTATGGNPSVEYMRSMLKNDGLNDAAIEDWINRYMGSSAATVTEQVRLIGQATSLEEIEGLNKRWLDGEVDAGRITAEEAAVHLKELQAKRGELLLKEYDTVSDDVQGEGAERAFNDKVQALYKSGDITDETRREIFGKYVKDSVKDTLKDEKKGKEPAVVVAEAAVALEADRERVGDDATDMLLNELAGEISTDGYRIVIAEHKILGGSNIKRVGVEVGIEVQGKKEIITVLIGENAPLAKNEKTIQLPGVGAGKEKGEIINYNGELWAYRGEKDGKEMWSKCRGIMQDGIGGKENAEAMRELLKRAVRTVNYTPADTLSGMAAYMQAMQ